MWNMVAFIVYTTVIVYEFVILHKVFKNKIKKQKEEETQETKELKKSFLFLVLSASAVLVPLWTSVAIYVIYLVGIADDSYYLAICVLTIMFCSIPLFFITIRRMLVPNVKSTKPQTPKSWRAQSVSEFSKTNIKTVIKNDEIQTVLK